MYWCGFTTPTIAAVAGVTETTVRYRFAIAAKWSRPSGTSSGRLSFSVRGSRQQGGRTCKTFSRNSGQGLLLAPRQPLPGNGPLASSSLAGSRSRGHLPLLKGRPNAIPGWDAPFTKKADDAVRSKQRLAEVADYGAAGNDWPRHNKNQ